MKEWRHTDPLALSKAIEANFADDDREQCRRAIRYLKRWKDLKFSAEGHAAPKGIGLTAAALQWFVPSKVRDGVANRVHYDDLKALSGLVSTMLANASPRLVVKLPVSPYDDLFRRMNDEQMGVFRNKLQDLDDGLRRARRRRRGLREPHPPEVPRRGLSRGEQVLDGPSSRRSDRLVGIGRVMHEHELTAVAEQLCAADLLEQARLVSADALHEPWAQTYGVVAAIDGVVHVEGHALSLRLGLRRASRVDCRRCSSSTSACTGGSSRVPVRVRLLPGTRGVLLDRYRPVAVAREALARAVETICRGLSGENAADFIEELALYWPGLPEGTVFFAAGAQIEPILRVVLPWTGTLAFVRDRAQALELIAAPMPFRSPELMALVEQGIANLAVSGLYIPLERVPRPPDPFPLGPWTRVQVVEFIRQNLSRGQRRRLEDHARGRAKPSFAIVRVPKPRGGEHLVGVQFDDIRGVHPLAGATGTAAMRQFRVERRDPGYLVPRGAESRRYRRSECCWSVAAPSAGTWRWSWSAAGSGT
ncbi:hypothetical protein [Nannocystis pusilla]|uniref:hypothetical protein n=1 Tax=Nannocystis pusilla TaxID=889268 RepID=UPI003B7EF180